MDTNTEERKKKVRFERKIYSMNRLVKTELPERGNILVRSINTVRKNTIISDTTCDLK